MRKLYRKLKSLMEAGIPAVLCAITASSGSTPRGSGAMMIVTKEGREAGTVGGGAVEYRAIRIAEEVLETGQSRTEPFILRKNEVQDIGMICGGEVRIDFEYLLPGSEAAKAALETIENRIRKLGTVYIFGGGHVGQALVPALSSVDFNCIVLEDREEFLKPELFPGASEVRRVDNEHISSAVDIGPDDYVCIMTRGHKDDMIIESQVLATPARYIGVIGSRKKTAGVNAQLMERGWKAEDIARITTPIGLDIKARTPEEIAISITAQLIRVRAE